MKSFKYKSVILFILFTFLTISCSSNGSVEENNTDENLELDSFLDKYGFETVNSQNEDGELPLQLAAFNGNVEIVRELIERGAEVDVRGLDGSTPLSHASISGFDEVVEILINAGADVNFRAEFEVFSETPLHQAAMNGHVNIIKALLDAGAEINSEGIDNMTPLHHAAWQGHLKVIEILIDRGATLDLKTEETQRTPLELALKFENYEAAKILIEAGANTGILYILDINRAGLFESGMTKEEVKELSKVYGEVEIEEIDLMAEGMSTPALELTFEGDESKSLVLQLSEMDSTVCRIEIYSDKFKSNRVIGIGSTFSDIVNNYWYDGPVWGDEGNPVVIVEEINTSFVLEAGDWWQMGEVVGEIPGDTKIIKIFTW